LFTFSLLVKISITTAAAATKTTTLVLTASFQDIQSKLIPEYQNSLDFAAASDDEGNFKINEDKILKNNSDRTSLVMIA